MGLSTGDAVTFGGTTATVEYGTGSTFTVTVPSGPAGTVNIAVNGTSLPEAFGIVTGGPGFSSPLTPGLTGLQEGAEAWSDFDKDERRDFVALGSASFPPTTKIYRNEGGGSFFEFTSFYGVAVGSAHWGDLEENDLDPDDVGILTPPADIQGSNSYIIVTGLRLASPVRLDGLVLTGGDARSSDSSTRSSGRAIHLRSAAVRGIGLTVIGNRAQGLVGEGGALFGEPSTSFPLANSVGAGNSASRGSAFAGPGEVAFVYTALVGHTGSSAVIRGGGPVRLLSVTATQDDGPVAETSGSRIQAANSIFWQNDTAGTGVYLRPLTSGTTVDLNHVLLEGNLTDGVDLATGIIGTQISILDQDPQFEDPDEADNTIGTSENTLRVPASSPAFDAGDASLLPTDAPELDGDENTAESLPVDLTGTARLVNGALDLDALETNPSSTLSTLADTTIDENPAFNKTLTTGDLNDPLSALTFSTKSSNPALATTPT